MLLWTIFDKRTLRVMSCHVTLPLRVDKIVLGISKFLTFPVPVKVTWEPEINDKNVAGAGFVYNCKKICFLFGNNKSRRKVNLWRTSS